MAEQIKKKPKPTSVGAKKKAKSKASAPAPQPERTPNRRTYRVSVALVMPITVQAGSREEAVRLARDKAMDSRLNWDDEYQEAVTAELDGDVGFHILRVQTANWPSWTRTN